MVRGQRDWESLRDGQGIKVRKADLDRLANDQVNTAKLTGPGA